MSISASATLFLGWSHLPIESGNNVLSILLTEEEYEELEDNDEYDFEQFIKDSGPTLASMHEAGISEEESTKRWRAQQDVLDACPIDEVHFGHYDYGSSCLAVRGTVTHVFEGAMEVIDCETLKIDPKKVSAAKEWFTANKLEWQEPKWLIVSSMG